MLETPHVVIGAVIATKIGNPFISLPLAFASHFVLEKIPHWNPHLNTEKKKYGKVTKNSTYLVAVDVVISLIIGFSLAFRVMPNTYHAVTILLACFVSVLPDVIEGPYFFFDFRNKYIKKWIAFQKSLQVDASPIPGLATQIVTVFSALWWILR